MPAKTQYPIDSVKLFKLLRSNQNTKNYSNRQLSALLGYCDARTLDKALKRGSITAKMLDSLSRFGIMYENYAGDKKVDECDYQDKQSGIDLDRLKSIIYDAVYNGIIDAMKS